MATHVSTHATQTASPLAGLISVSQGDLEAIAEEKGGDFLSLMLASLEEIDAPKKGKNPLLDTLLSDDVQVSDELLESIPLLKLDEELESLELKEATFVQILQFLEHLNGGKEVRAFRRIDDKLNMLFKDASIMQEFKGAKDIKDLMELSKKYDLGLEKISISKQDLNALKEVFPKLESKGFFKSLRTALTSEELLHVNKKSPQSIAKKEDIKPQTQTLNNILQTITKDKKSENILHVKSDEVKSAAKEVEAQKRDLKADVKANTKTDIKLDTKVDVKQEIMQHKDVKKEAKIDTSVKAQVEQKNDTKTQINEPIRQPDTKSQPSVKVSEKIDTKQVDENLHVKKDVKPQSDFVKKESVETVKSEEIKTVNKENVKSVKIDTAQKEDVKVEPKTNPKNETAQKAELGNTIQPNKILNEEVKAQNSRINEVKMQNTQSQANRENLSENRSENGETKQENHSNSFAKEVGKSDSLHVKSSNLKHTLNTFAQEFKEKVEEYKPPIMKVKMTLNPKALGEMDVTIVNRGSNLHVSINSNTGAMNLFLQNQAEFKNSLVNMGFTNLEMNFSNQKQNQQQGKNQNGTRFASSFEDEEEMTNENTLLEITLPEYI